MNTLETTKNRLLRALSLRKQNRSSEGIRYEIADHAGHGDSCLIPLGDTSSLFLFDVTMKCGTAIHLNGLDVLALLYLRQGTMTLCSGDSQTPVCPERLYSFGRDPSARLEIGADERAEGFLVLLDAERWFCEKRLHPESVGQGALWTSRRMASELNTVLSQITHCPIRSQKRLSALYCRAKADELLTLCVDILTRKVSPATPEQISPEDYARVQLVADYIRSHPEEPIDAARMEQLALMNRTKLKALFKQILGVTMTEHRGILRGERAKQLLRTTQMPVADVSEALGFHSASAFCRFFRERFHLSPTEYRKQNT